NFENHPRAVVVAVAIVFLVEDPTVAAGGGGPVEKAVVAQHEAAARGLAVVMKIVSVERIQVGEGGAVGSELEHGAGAAEARGRGRAVEKTATEDQWGG